MMTCKNCGTQLPDNAVFCNVCGMKQEAAPVQPEISAVPEQPVQPEISAAPEQPMQPEVSAAPEQPMQYQNPYPMNNGMQYQNVQPMDNAAQYQNPYPMNNGMQYQNAQPMNNGMQYQNVQPMNNGMQYQNGYQMNGATYPNNQMGYNPYGYQNAQPAKNKKTGLIIGLIIAAIVIVAIALVIVLLNGGNKSYKAAIKQFMQAMEDEDMSAMVETFPKPLREELKSEMLSWYGSEEVFWAAYSTMIEDYCGSNAKLSYEIMDAEPYDAEDLIEIEEVLADDYDYECNVTAAYEVEVEITYKGRDGEYSEYVDFLAMEIKGEWYLIMD